MAGRRQAVVLRHRWHATALAGGASLVRLPGVALLVSRGWRGGGPGLGGGGLLVRGGRPGGN
jgi:hypothetical protein